MFNFETVALFSGLEPHAFDMIRASARQSRVAHAHYLFSEHEPATDLYILRSGWVRLVKLSGDGRQSVTRLVGPTEVAGMSTILDHGIYRLTAQTVTTCQIFTWGKRDLDELVRRYPQISGNAIRLLSSYLDELQTQYIELATERVEQRIAHALIRIAERPGVQRVNERIVLVPLLQRDIADLVGVTHYTVSRVLGDWRKQALITTGHARIEILDLQRLQAYAEL